MHYTVEWLLLKSDNAINVVKFNRVLFYRAFFLFLLSVQMYCKLLLFFFNMGLIFFFNIQVD